MSEPVVSVVIPVHNSADTLVEQLDAVARAQRSAPPSEILIIDNRSTDNSRQLAHAWRRRNSDGISGSDIRIICADERASEPYARNVGLAFARGRYVAYCDADDRVTDSWLRVLCELLDEGVYATGPVDMTAMNPAWIANVRGSQVTGKSMLLNKVPYAHGCNMGFDRDTLIELGGFDERYTAGCDLDIAIRMWESGHELQYSQDAGIAYRLRPSLLATYKQGLFYGRYRIPILARLTTLGCTAANGTFTRLLWLIRRAPEAAFQRATRARWVWVSAQLVGERLGTADDQIIDLRNRSSGDLYNPDVSQFGFEAPQ